jgi:uracil-DNA glycosylase
VFGHDKDDFGFYQIVSCFDGSIWKVLDKKSREVAEQCIYHLDKVVELTKPRVILAMGQAAYWHLTAMSGDKMKLENVRGYPVEGVRYDGINGNTDLCAAHDKRE